MSDNTFGSRRPLAVGDQSYTIYDLSALDRLGVERLPYSLKILLENLLRHEDGVSVTAEDIEALARWDPERGAPRRDRLLPGADPDAGLHRRARRRRPGRHARRRRGAGRRPGQGQPAASRPSW